MEAGHDIISWLPTLASANHSDGGSGAFGAPAGDVSIKAGNNVFGHYVLRNGVGTINAGGNAGEINRQLALSLVTGAWTVVANEIVLQEVRNPNGTFNRTGTQLNPTPTRFAFDYSAEASVTLRGSLAVTLLGAVIPRLPNLAIPILYPPSVSIEAGSGGVQLGSDVTLFPAPNGQLSIQTTDRGALKSTDALEPRRLTLSDSASRRFDFQSGRFGNNDHDPTLLHRQDSLPVKIDVSGNIEGIQLSAGKAIDVHVGGDLVASSVVSQNLRSTDRTSILVKGDIRNRNAFTFVTLPTGIPDIEVGLLDVTYPPISGITLLYDPKTREIAFRGRMTEDQSKLLKTLTVREFDALGHPILQPDGEPLTRTISFIPGVIVDALFRQSQDVPRQSGDGYQAGGPGMLSVEARRIDLGITPGIVSYGARFNFGLADCSSAGAAISVKASESLSLFSSAIASIAGGAVTVRSGGTIDVGTQRDLGTTDAARGIYTASKADVEVVADGNIELNGSRIAAYDGGSIRVRSERGNVNAGAGGLGFARVDQLRLEGPDCTTVIVRKAIPGSGILATTFPGSMTQLGDITVETPLGNIIASSGGIAQVSLGNAPSPGGKVKLVAGTRNADGSVLHPGTIDASNSGVIGSDITLSATADIKGVVFSRGDLNISTPQNVNVVALAGGAANVSAGGAVSGTIVGIGSANVSGGTGIDANVLSQNATTRGTTQGQVGFAQSAVAGATSQASTADSQAKNSAAVTAPPESTDADTKKKPRLAKTVGRVQVILNR